MDDLADAKLEERLRRGFEGPVADDGFSARVMHALPPRPRRAAALLPAALSIGGLLTGLALLPSSLVQNAAPPWGAGQAGAGLWALCAVVLGMGLLACAWALEEER